ncbi:response regulator [Cellulosilyticum sp. I15G10I2]|uniref:response regulator n=1 Tax=Cellulosilyticum sp. I15G10I2 TaxID=1892843 RepID=UPI00085C2813|nr:response regulator [Cellulosilyticum sp. I15G10I2]
MERYKILIVDDESIERDAIKFILKKEALFDFEFFEAVNGQDAISSAALHTPDIILMDIQMPGLNGIEATKVIKKILQDSKIIFLTAYDQFDYAHEAIKLGVQDFILKPATNERFIEVIKKTVEMLQEEKEQKLRKKEMESKLEQVTKYLENEFLTSLINGDIEEGQGKEYLEFNRVNFKWGMGIVISTKADPEAVPSMLRLQMLRKRFLEKFETRLDMMVNHKYTIILKDYIYVFALGDTQNELLQVQQKIREAINEISVSFAEEHKLYADFGIGDPCNKLDCLWKSFWSAKGNCNKRQPIKESMSEQNLKALVKSLNDQDEESFTRYIELVFEDISHPTQTIEHLRVKLYEQFILIRDWLSDKIFDTPLHTFDLFNQTMQIKTEHEAKCLLREFAHQYMEKINKQKTDKSSIILDQLIVYINMHYAENLTLDQLSSVCYLSPSYISKVFKKHLNTNFIDYLSSVRIRVAKRLMKNPELSMKEISSEIGYVDPNYFTRVFKKYEGITPSEYRSKFYTGGGLEKEYEDN